MVNNIILLLVFSLIVSCAEKQGDCEFKYDLKLNGKKICTSFYYSSVNYKSENEVFEKGFRSVIEEKRFLNAYYWIGYYSNSTDDIGEKGFFTYNKSKVTKIAGADIGFFYKVENSQYVALVTKGAGLTEIYKVDDNGISIFVTKINATLKSYYFTNERHFLVGTKAVSEPIAFEVKDDGYYEQDVSVSWYFKE